MENVTRLEKLNQLVEEEKMYDPRYHVFDCRYFTDGTIAYRKLDKAAEEEYTLNRKKEYYKRAQDIIEDTYEIFDMISNVKDAIDCFNNEAILFEECASKLNHTTSLYPDDLDLMEETCTKLFEKTMKNLAELSAIIKVVSEDTNYIHDDYDFDSIVILQQQVGEALTLRIN